MRASLLLAPVFLLGCTEGLISVKDAASGDEANNLDDTDTGSGGGGGTGGGLAERYLVGSFTTSGRSYSRGQLGLAFVSAYTGSLVCDFEGSVTYQRAASTPCPDCTWTFDLSPVTGSRTLAGSSCGALGFSSGILDGAWDYSWGFAPEYYMYGYGLFLYDAVMIDVGGYWAPVAYNLPWYGVYGTYVSGSTVEFAKPFADAYGNTYFYY